MLKVYSKIKYFGTERKVPTKLQYSVTHHLFCVYQQRERRAEALSVVLIVTSCSLSLKT